MAQSSDMKEVHLSGLPRWPGVKKRPTDVEEESGPASEDAVTDGSITSLDESRRGRASGAGGH